MPRAIRWIALALALMVPALPASALTPDVGQMAPAFSLSTPDGQALSLSSLTQKGTVVLVVLRGYPGYQCPYCTKQVHDFIEHANKFQGLGAQVLLVYPGPSANLDQRANEALAQQNPLPGNVHLVVDPDYTFTNQYGLRWNAAQETAYPATFLIDQHNLVFFRKVSAGHADRSTAAEVLARLQSAGH